MSVTRLRLGSWLRLPQFLLDNERAAGQARHSPGFVKGALLADRKLAFWTITGWESQAAMKGYRGSEAHASVMPKLAKWCDEAITTRWEQESAELPSWQEAHRRLVESGRLSKVEKPSSDHLNRAIPAPKTTMQRVLQPAR